MALKTRMSCILAAAWGGVSVLYSKAVSPLRFQSSRLPTGNHLGASLSMILFVERHARDDHGCYRPVRCRCLRILYLGDDIHAVGDAAEDRVLRIEERIIRGIQEKLAAVGVRPGIRHRYGSLFILIIFMYLVGELIPRSARSPPRDSGVVFGERVPALDHESLDDTVKFRPIIETFFRELHEIRDRVRRIGLHQLNRDIALGGM